jgi:hypothetical protein
MLALSVVMARESEGFAEVGYFSTWMIVVG